MNIKLSVLIVIALAILNNLFAIETKIEFFSKENIPTVYAPYCSPGSCTILHSVGWRPGSTILVSEINEVSKKQKSSRLTIPQFGDHFVYVISSSGYLPGCPITYSFRDPKIKTLREKITLIPNRLCVKSLTDNAQIEAILVSLNLLTYKFEFTDFAEKENIILKSCCYDEEIKNQFQIGVAAICISPEVENKLGGLTTLTFTRPSGEVLKMELPWGLEWLKDCVNYDENGKIKCIVDDPEFQKENPQIMEYFRPKSGQTT